jgi:hypothetical protein
MKHHKEHGKDYKVVNETGYESKPMSEHKAMEVAKELCEHCGQPFKAVPADEHRLALEEVIKRCAAIKHWLLTGDGHLSSYVRELDYIPQRYLVGYQDKAIRDFEHLLREMHEHMSHNPEL